MISLTSRTWRLAVAPPSDPGRMAGFSLPILATGAFLIVVIKPTSQPLFIDFFTMWTGGRRTRRIHALD